MIKKIPMFFIKIYQRTLSPDHGPFSFLFPEGFCRYHPTCSEYAYQAIDKYGMLKGSAMSFWRILRCNPFSKVGHDPVR